MPHSLVPAAVRWADLVERLEHSNLTAAQFAAQHRLNLGTLRWWRSQLKRHPRTPAGFVEVMVDPPTAAPLRLRLGDRACVLEVDATTDLQLVRRLVEALC